MTHVLKSFVVTGSFFSCLFFKNACLKQRLESTLVHDIKIPGIHSTSVSSVNIKKKIQLVWVEQLLTV